MQIRFADAVSDVAPRHIFVACGDAESGAANFATASYSARSTVIAQRQKKGPSAIQMIWHVNARSAIRPAAGIDLARNDWRALAGHQAGIRADMWVRDAAPSTDYNGVMRHIEFVGNGA